MTTITMVRSPKLSDVDCRRRRAAAYAVLLDAGRRARRENGTGNTRNLGGESVLPAGDAVQVRDLDGTKGSYHDD